MRGRLALLIWAVLLYTLAAVPLCKPPPELFFNFVAAATISASSRRANSNACSQIPYATEQRIFFQQNKELFLKNRKFGLPKSRASRKPKTAGEATTLPNERDQAISHFPLIFRIAR